MAAQLKPEEKPSEPPANEPENREEGGEQRQAEGRDYEAEARAHGWVSKEEFTAKPNADPERWVDAETFVKRADEVMPLLKAKNARLERDLEEMKRQQRQFSKFASKAEERIRAELQAKMEEAVEAGDKDAFKALQKEADELGSADSGKPRHSKEEALDAFETFRDENPWYDRGNLAGASEIEMSARVYADRLTEKRLRELKPGEEPPPSEFFGAIADEVRAKYPSIIANGTRQQRQKPASDVSAPGQRPPSRNARSYDALPPEAKRQCDKWIENKIIDMGTTEKSRDFFAKNFDWDKWQKEAAR